MLFSIPKIYKLGVVFLPMFISINTPSSILEGIFASCIGCVFM